MDGWVVEVLIVLAYLLTCLLTYLLDQYNNFVQGNIQLIYSMQIGQYISTM